MGVNYVKFQQTILLRTEALCQTTIPNRVRRSHSPQISSDHGEAVWQQALVTAYVPALRECTAGENDSALTETGPTIEGAIPITLRINGKDHQLRIDPRTTTIDCIVRRLR